ncbi:hypothetical protein J6590_004315 [Homalodisca vitripennis]|nr:hypothetical protein J6590_004315 [Homalodisca vitripennis]
MAGTILLEKQGDRERGRGTLPPESISWSIGSASSHVSRLFIALEKVNYGRLKRQRPTRRVDRVPPK